MKDLPMHRSPGSRSRVLAFFLCLAFFAPGCVSHNLPKDSYLEGVKSKISTPWGTGELEVEKAATGTAAKSAASLK